MRNATENEKYNFESLATALCLLSRPDLIMVWHGRDTLP